MEVGFRWMTPDDVPALGALAHRIWHSHYPGIITTAQIDYMLAKTYSPASLHEQLESGHRFLLATQADAILGFLAIAPLAMVTNAVLRGSDVTPSDYFLQKFYVAPEAQGQGLGKKMLAEILRQKPEVTRLRLQVARKNTNSWNFYKKQGFVIEQAYDFDIGDGYVMEDYVMEKRIA